MASFSTARIYAFKADAAIAAFKAVKIGTDHGHVAVGAANTNRCIGIAMTAAINAEDVIEVAIPGGGAKALLGEGVSAGNYLVSHTDGTLVKANAASDHVVAFAMEDGSSGDIIAVEVVCFNAHAAE
jgi:hypothetical protein